MAETPQQPTPLSPSDFAAKIRAKYPGAYDNTNDSDLTNRVIAKYPQYKSMVQMAEPAQSATSSGYPGLAYAKPGPYTTTLPPAQEQQFQSWVKQNKIPWQDTPTSDYDMRGYWQAQQAGDPNAQRAANQHFPDTWKTPYDLSFSNESKYALPTAPKWRGNQLIDSKGNVVFDEALGSDGQQAARRGDAQQPTSNGSPSQPQQPASFWDKAKQAIVGPGTMYATATQTTLPTGAYDATRKMLDIATAPAISAEPFVGGQPKSVLGGMGKATAEVASGLTSPMNIGVMLATGGLGELGAAGGAVEKLIAAGFSAEQIKGAYDQFKQINPSNTSGEFAYHATAGILQGLMAKAGAKHALDADIPPAAKAPETTFIPDTQAKTPEQVFRESSLAPIQADQEAPKPAENKSQPAVPEAPIVSESALISSATPIQHGTIENENGGVIRTAAPGSAKNIFELENNLVQSGRITQKDVPYLRRQALDAWMSAGRPGLREDYYGDALRRLGSISASSPAPTETEQAPESQAPPQVQSPAAVPPQTVPSSFVPPVPRDLTQLHPALASNFDAMSKLQMVLDRSTDETAKADTLEKMATVQKVQDSLVADTLNKTPPLQLSKLRDNLDSLADKHQTQSDAITDALNKDALARTARQAAIDLKQRGYTTYSAATDPNTGEAITAVKPAEADTMMRSVYSELQGETPRVTLADFTPHPHKEGYTDEQWQQFVPDALARLKADKDAIVRDAQNYSNVGDMADSNIPSRIKELGDDAKYLGSFPAATIAPGRRPVAPLRTEAGELRPMQPLETITKARANELLGTKNINKIPAQDVFDRRAAQLSNLAQQHRALSDAISQKIGLKSLDTSEKGAVGESTTPLATPSQTSTDAILRSAKANGIDSWKVTDAHPSGPYGWLAPDGKGFLPLGRTPGTDALHSDIADTVLPEFKNDVHDTASLALLQNGWVRKVMPNEYEAHRLDDRQTDTIEMDMFRNRTHGQQMRIDTKDGTGRIRALYLDPGWDESYSNLKEAVDAEKRRVNFPAQSGIAPGFETMGGMAAGMAIGHAIGGAPGAAAGAVVGSIAPSVLRSAAVADNMKKMWPAINKAGISVKDWFGTSLKNSVIDPAIDQAGQDRLTHQWIYKNAPELNLASRISLLPSKIAVALNPYARINDQAGPIERWAMANDTKLKAFRDAQGKFSVDESPYVAAMLAADNIRGKINNYRSAFYGAIERAINATSDKAVTNHYLNLRGDLRTYDNLDAQSQDLQKQMGSLQQQLAAPNLGAVEEARLQDQLRATQNDHRDLIDRVSNGEVVSGGFTRQQVEQRLQQFQQQLGQDRLSRVQSYANRLYDVNRKVLDLAYNDGKGTISKEAYDTYTARGNEYIPMKRILSDQAENLKNSFGKDSPLYLNHTNVIHQMEGSERDNIDPIQASTNQMMQVVTERYRNDAMLKMLYSAAGDPLGIGSFFKRVGSGYKPDADHQVVGAYIDGKVQQYEVPKELSAVLEHGSLRGTNLLSNGWVRAATGLAKFGMTTGNLAFTARQSVTMATKLVVGRAGVDLKNPMSDTVALGKTFARTLKSAFVHDDTWHEANEMGVLMGNIQNQFTPELQMSPKELAGNLAKTVGTYSLRHPITTMAAINNLASDTAKITAYSRYRQMGHSPVEAQYLTKTYGPLPNYDGMGAMNPNLAGAVKAATLFLSADLVHLEQVASMAMDKQIQPKMALLYMGSMAAVYAMAQHNAQQKNPDGSLMINEISDAVRNRNMVYLTGGRDAQGRPNYIRIPKTDIHRTLFNSSEDVMYKVLGQSDKSNKQIVADQISNLIPSNPDFDANQVHSTGSAIKEGIYKTATGLYSQILPAVRTPFEEVLNRQVNFGRVAPIDSEKNISTGMQGFGSSQVSPAAMWAGNKIGISPNRIEHIVRNNFGPLATGGEALINPLFQGQVLSNGMKIPAYQGIPKAATANAAEQAAISKFRADAGVIAQPYTDYLQAKQQNPNAAEQWAQQHRDEVQRGSIAYNGMAKLGHINSVMQQVQSMDLDPNTKAQMIDNIKSARKTLMDNITSLMNPQTQKTQSGYGTGNATVQLGK